MPIFNNEATSEVRRRHFRAVARLNSRVPVAVAWSEAGQELRSDGYTQDISPRGCLAVVPREFVLGQRLALVNLTNNSRCEVVLVWRGHQSPAGWELGLEMQDPPADFWGVDF